MADDEVVERKDATERRVYNLPVGLVEKLRAYQASQSISSETEAARRLLETALQMRDSIFDILELIDSRLDDERDLRVIASELVKHILVSSVSLSEGGLTFSMSTKDRGKISDNNNSYGARRSLHYSHEDRSYEDWDSYSLWKRENKAKVKEKPSPSEWQPTGGDLDDEIPF